MRQRNDKRRDNGKRKGKQVLLHQGGSSGSAVAGSAPRHFKHFPAQSNVLDRGWFCLRCDGMMEWSDLGC
jgi:hypothetical protein